MLGPRIALLIVLLSTAILSAQTNPFQGDWTCISKGKDISRLAHEQVGEWESFAPIGNLQIRNNNIAFFEYPCQYLGTKSLTKIDKSWLFFEDEQTVRTLSMRGDTLVVTTGDIGGLVEEYERDTFDVVVVTQLKQGVLNPNCLAGKWSLVRNEWCCYGSYLEYAYPYSSIQDTICLDSSIANGCYKDKRYVLLKIDGAYQKCSVEYRYDFIVERQSLWLTPLNSREGKVPILFRRLEDE